MKLTNLILPLALAGACAVPSRADITVKLLPGAPTDTLTLVQSPLVNDPTLQAPEPVKLAFSETVRTQTVKNAQFPAIVMLTDGGYGRLDLTFSKSPQEDILIEVDEKGKANATGTPLIAAMNELDGILAPIQAQFGPASELYEKDPAAGQKMAEELEKQYFQAVKDYIAAHRGQEVVLYGILQLEGQDQVDAFAAMNDAERASVLTPLVTAEVEKTKKKIADEAATQAMQSGTVPAPAFTLPDAAGKMISLSDYRGKWVILDFWGSWCRWCVKGFPELKEIYAARPANLEIIGIDCRDTPEQWKSALKKYELPWVNLYNDCTGEQNALLEAYRVQGFPTKVIVGPDGNIRKIVVGADPTFPEILRNLMK